MLQSFELPSYLDQEPAVAERFSRIYQRPVVLDVRGLGKTFPSRHGDVEALHDVSFKVYRREFICVIGPSGCGKSTLIRILAGLDHPTAGAVVLDEREVSGPGPDRGMVFQNYTLFPWLTVKRNVMFGPRMKGLKYKPSEAEAHSLDSHGGARQVCQRLPAPAFRRHEAARGDCPDAGQPAADHADG